MTALNPVMRVGAQIAEAVRAHHPELPPKVRPKPVLAAMHEVASPRRPSAAPRLSAPVLRRPAPAHPHRHGHHQPPPPAHRRRAHHRARRHRPGADSRPARDLRRTHGLAMLFISHDLAVVSQIADRVAVMQHGRIVEQAATPPSSSAPQHPYTRRLLASAPTMHTDRTSRLATLASEACAGNFAYTTASLSIPIFWKLTKIGAPQPCDNLSMRALILSDIHANLEALTAVLAAPVSGTQLWNLGDLVGYGASPNQVIDRIRRSPPGRARQSRPRLLRPHLAQLLQPHRPRRRQLDRAELTPPKTWQWLRELFRKVPLQPEHPGVTCAHGSPLNEDHYILNMRDAWAPLQQMTTAITFFGHTHIQGGFSQKGHDWHEIRPRYTPATTPNLDDGDRTRRRVT
jgi:predicted phosphodiesterase